jgi:hypothetical protein
MENGNSPVTKADLVAAVNEIKSYVREQVYEVETKLVRAFADYSSGTNIRFLKLEADAGNANTANSKRLGSLESKIAELEMRIVRLESQSDIPPPQGEAAA